MILHQTEVEQTVDRDERARFVKELVVAKVRGPGKADVPLAMVRKRLAVSPGKVGGTLAPVLLVHGFGQNRYAWHLPGRSFSNYLARAGFDVFNLDLRGHGRSRHLGAKRPTDVADFVREDVPAAIEEIQKLSGGRPIYYLGHSLGGLIGYAAAPSLEGALAGLGTLGSPYHFTRGSWSLTALGHAMLAIDQRLGLGHAVAPLKGLGEAMRITRSFLESPLWVVPLRGYAAGSMEPHVLGQHMSLAMDAGSVAVLRNLFRGGFESRRSGHRLGGLPGFMGAFEGLDLPLLVVSGTADDLAPPESVEPAFALSRSTDKTYRAFPRGHIDLLVGRDAPLTVWPLIEAWIKKRVRARGELPSKGMVGSAA